MGRRESGAVSGGEMTRDEESRSWWERALSGRLTPTMNWVKNDPKKHQWFEDGSEFLVALRVTSKGRARWEFDVVRVNCDGEGMSLEYREGESYSSWSWSNFEWFMLLDGTMPTERPNDGD